MEKLLNENPHSLPQKQMNSQQYLHIINIYM